MLISIQGTGKNQLELDQENTWNAVEFVTLFLLRKSRPKPTGVLERFREGETNRSFSVFWGVSF